MVLKRPSNLNIFQICSLVCFISSVLPVIWNKIVDYSEQVFLISYPHLHFGEVIMISLGNHKILLACLVWLGWHEEIVF